MFLQDILASRIFERTFGAVSQWFLPIFFWFWSFLPILVFGGGWGHLRGWVDSSVSLARSLIFFTASDSRYSDTINGFVWRVYISTTQARFQRLRFRLTFSGVFYFSQRSEVDLMPSSYEYLLVAALFLYYLSVCDPMTCKLCYIGGSSDTPETLSPATFTHATMNMGRVTRQVLSFQFSLGCKVPHGFLGDSLARGNSLM